MPPVDEDYRMVETIRFFRRNLPHWLVADRTYFVTMRVAGTLPRRVVAELAAEREALYAAKCVDEDEWLALHRRQFLHIETLLDTAQANAGLSLTTGALPQAIMDSFGWLAREAGWTVWAATVMPTHVHVVMRNRSGRSGELLDDLARLKRFTGRTANRVHARKGEFWARDDFDHWCRTPEKVEAAVRYVRGNPVKAGLVSRWDEWAWTTGEWP
jgi:putative transposase